MNDLNVLIIEDDVIARQEMAKLVGKEGFVVFPAGDGNEANVLFSKNKVDIVISDIKLPGMSGIQVMQGMKKTHPHLPVIFITAFSDVDAALEAIRIGALDYIKKPLEISNLLTALGRARALVEANAQGKLFPVVLFADDEAVARKNLAKVLRDENCHVIEAENGQVALSLFKENKVDIVLLDIKMPVMDGITALHEMRKLSDDFEAIIQTGFGDETTAIQALRDGAMNFIKKPVDLDELIVLIEKARETIMLKRAFKYRGRELELAQQIIAQISQFDDIVISAKDTTLDQLKKNSVKMADFLSSGLLLVSDNLRVVHANEFVKKAIDTPEKIDSVFVDRLIKQFGYGLSATEVMSAITTCFHAPAGQGTVLAKDGKDCLLLARVNLKMRQSCTGYVLLLLK